MAKVSSSNTTTLYSTTQTTPVLAGADVPQGQVNDTNFTTLYSNTASNATGGGVSGNLLVTGNLRVLGTSDLEGAVTISNSYTMPTSDGTNLQVLSTDGHGNATWQNISSVAGYALQADTVTGGADLTLTQVGTPVDSVKFAGGTNITVSRTDANTITISTVADNIPDGTAKGQVLYWDGSAWTANSTITSAASNDRFVLQYDNSGAGSNAAVFLRKNYGASTYTTNDGVGLAFQLDSNSQATNQLATINAQWNASAPYITLNTNVNNNTTGPFVAAATFSTAQATLPGDLAVNGGDITTTNVTGNLFNTNATVVNIGDAATTEVNLGSALSGRVQIKPNTIVGANTTQNVFNTVATTVNAFGASTATNIGAATGTTTIGNVLAVNGETVTINANGTDADSYLYFKDSTNTDYLKWNKTDTRFEFSDQLYISETDPPAIFERRVLAATLNPSEQKASLRLYERVTDAVSNATDDGGPSIVFGRTSGNTAPTARLFASMGSAWYGTTNKAALQFNWTTDDFTETTPGLYPQTYTLLELGSDDATFFNNSLYVDYAYVDSTKTATSITGGNTLVFGSAHGYTAGSRILYQTATQNGLTQSTYYYVIATGLTSTQCQVSLTAGGSAVALTNGTGLTLTFATVSNRVGVNTTTPAYTLDVNGDLGVSGDIYISGYQIDINSPQAGQAILFDGTKFLNSNEYEFTNAAYRSQFINNSSTVGSVASAEFLKRRASLVDGYISGQLIGQVVGTTETYTHRVLSQYQSSGNNQYLIQTDPVGNFNPASTTITTQLAVDTNDLFLNGTNLTFNANGAGSAAVATAGLTVERGTTGGDATFKWVEADLRWAANGTIYTAGNFVADGPSVSIDADSTATESFLYMRGTTEYLKWNNSLTQFELSDDLEIDGDLTVTGNDIKKSGGTTVITFSGTNLTTLAGDLQVNGNSIRGSTAVDAIEISGADVDIAGNLNAASVTIDNTRAKIDSGNTSAWSPSSTITLTTTDKNLEKAMFYITDGTDVHALEALVLRTGTLSTDTKLTIYGEMYTSTPLASFTADISGGALRIRGTNLSATNTLTVSIVATSLL